jgi:D-methionine transport system substrate-binding protein
MKNTRTTFATALIVTALVSVPVFAKGNADKNQTVKTVKVGVTTDDPRLWNAVQAELDARGKKIKIETVFFDGGAAINKATADGDLDLNGFQHYAFFYQNVQDQKIQNLVTPVAETLIVPLSLFTDKKKYSYKSPADLPRGAKIIVPDDPTNQGRALYVLASAGLITLKPDAGFNGLLRDIQSNPKNIQFIEITGAQIPRALPDANAAIINVYAAVNAGLDPVNDPIYQTPVDADNPALKPFFNILVARTADKDAQYVRDIVEAYQSARVARAILEVYKNAAVPVFKY